MNAKQQNVREIDLTLNGNHCHGFPMTIAKGSPVWPFYKKLDVLGRLQNPSICYGTELKDFATHLFYSHKFEGEDTTQGWLGVSLTLDSSAGFSEAYSLGNALGKSELK